MTYHLILKVRLVVTARSVELACAAARAALPADTQRIDILECEAAQPSVHRQRDDFDREEFYEPVNLHTLAEIKHAA